MKKNSADSQETKSFNEKPLIASGPYCEVTPFEKFVVSFRQFLKRETSSGILLLIALGVALFWANFISFSSYYQLWHLKAGFKAGDFVLIEPLHRWINDGLMAIFFFVVGLEIKREIIAGELSSFKKAVLPMVAAVGGMVIPALIYTAFNFNLDTLRGWGIPMATDIAFALGVLSLLGGRIPTGVKIFLTALAIADDLGAVLVIAIFYTSEINLFSLGVGFIILFCMAFGNWLGVRSWLFYVVLGLGSVWFAFFFSGVHPTVAGVLAAFCVPARTRLNSNQFLEQTKELITVFSRPQEREEVLIGPKRLAALSQLRDTINKASTPLQRIEEMLHPWVALIILPLFALANSGVKITPSMFGEVWHQPETLGVILGLFLGKPAGIFLASWLLLRFKLAELPSGVSYVHILGAGALGGIGFTMSLFIANLAFLDNPHYIELIKLAILFASVLSSVLGIAVLTLFTKRGEIKRDEEVLEEL
ncbi:MAG: Na+/H+ antiporter NhaA [Candidatus Dadabacteria bacterium]|nr:MAG: Na+/H+ antiporter NhaA [Candidatus Dadabacteria bacterium]